MAITTIYRGIEYRSRLEARWAAFFTALDWRFTFEPFDGDGYIPDFVIHGDAPLLIEVKPAVTPDEYRAPIAKLERGLRAHWQHDVLIVGASPISQLESFSGLSRPVAGLIGEPHWGWDDPPTLEGWQWQPAEWITCLKCSAVALIHPEMSFTSRPCGCYEGDHYLGHISRGRIDSAWAMACNEVKWKGHAA